MTPFDALDKAIMYSGAVDNKPGAVIKRMPKDVREKLEKLTSDDAYNVRILRSYWKS